MAGFFTKLISKFSGTPKIDWDELEADLVTADIGIKRTMLLVDKLRERKGITADGIVETTREMIREGFPDQVLSINPRADGQPTVILVVGVNGAGKTTSVAKLGHLLQKQGHQVLLAAADTFRAAAVEQLESWTTRLHLPLYKGSPNQDPASVCYEAHERAIREGAQFLICDTAGRLHTRHNLMEELSKIRRTIAKQDESAPHVTLLVVDATTGANALSQAKEFHKATPLDGVVITKLDGSGKGGVALALMDELKIAPVYLGTGEGSDDFEIFDKNRFVDALL
ncbi:MAG: signal recognition particle-docking protein FtsY [Akkermansia sp.]